MLKVDNLSFAYGNHTVLKNVSFSVNSGEFVGILGNNGSGKTTLIKCINRILKPQSGTVTIREQDLSSLKPSKIAQHVAYLPQQTEAIPFTVFEAVLVGRSPYIKFNPTNQDIKIVQAILQDMGLTEIAQKRLSELSGGQLQKVMIARATAQQTKILLLDEPTNNLDIKSQHELLSQAHNLCHNGTTVIAVLHDINLALRYCTRFIFLKNGALAYDIAPADINSALLKDIFDIDISIVNIAGVNTTIPQ